MRKKKRWVQRGQKYVMQHAVKKNRCRVTKSLCASGAGCLSAALHSEDRSHIWQMKKILWQISSAISCKRIDIKRFIEDIKPGNKVNITFYTAVLHSSSK